MGKKKNIKKEWEFRENNERARSEEQCFAPQAGLGRLVQSGAKHSFSDWAASKSVCGVKHGTSGPATA